MPDAICAGLSRPQVVSVQETTWENYDLVLTGINFPYSQKVQMHQVNLVKPRRLQRMPSLQLAVDPVTRRNKGADFHFSE
jgi:hypothetical protein